MSGSDYTTTPNLGLYKPTFNADVSTWGGHWNTNADTLDAALATGSGGTFLPIAGGQMGGAIVLAADPASAMEACTRQYADKMLPLAGGTVTGNLNSNAVTNLGSGQTNYIQVTGAAANPTIQVAGGGTNGAMLLRSQGTGAINLGSVTSGNILQLVAAATNGDTLTVTQPATAGGTINFDAVQGTASGGFLFRRFVQMANPITLSGTMATSPLWFNFGNNISGTNTVQQGYMSWIGSNSDTATPNAGAGSLTLLNVQDRLATGWGGSRVGVAANLSTIGATTGGALSLIGISGLSVQQFNAGGVSAGFGTTQFGVGGNFGGVLGVGMTASATYMRGQTGLEIDVHALAGSSLTAQVGLQIVHDGAHAVQGTVTDVALRIADQTSATIGWKDAITVGTYDSRWPVDPNGYVFQLQNGVGLVPSGAGGIDLLQAAWSGMGPEGGGFAFRSVGASGIGATAIDGSGGIKIGSGYINANSSGIVIDAPLFVLSGTPTVVAGGTNYTTGDLVADGFGNLFTATAAAGVVTAVSVFARAEGSATDHSGTVSTTARTRVGAALGTGLTLSEAWAQSTKSIQVASAGGRVGFLGTAPIARPTVSGAKGGNAALASLLTALASYGLVTDSSTA